MTSWFTAQHISSSLHEISPLVLEVTEEEKFFHCCSQMPWNLTFRTSVYTYSTGNVLRAFGVSHWEKSGFAKQWYQDYKIMRQNIFLFTLFSRDSYSVYRKGWQKDSGHMFMW